MYALILKNRKNYSKVISTFTLLIETSIFSTFQRIMSAKKLIFYMKMLSSNLYFRKYNV